MSDFKLRVIQLTSQQILLSSQLSELKERLDSDAHDVRSKKSLRKDYIEVKENLYLTKKSLAFNRELIK